MVEYNFCKPVTNYAGDIKICAQKKIQIFPCTINRIMAKTLLNSDVTQRLREKNSFIRNLSTDVNQRVLVMQEVCIF